MLSNLDQVKKDLSNSKEFNTFVKHTKSVTVLPDDFKWMAGIFDSYCEWHIERYNMLIDKLFELISDESMLKQKDSYKIKRRKKDTDGTSNVTKKIDELQAAVKAAKDKGSSIVKDSKSFENIAVEIKKIEIKLNKLVSS